MKKIIAYLIVFLLMATPTWTYAATWFAGSGDTDFNAVSGGTTSSVWNSNADGTSGTYLDFSTQPSNGDIFVANGATIAIDDSIGSGSVTVTLTTEGTDYGGTDGGGFTFNINTNDAETLYVNVTAGTTPGLIVTGEGAGADTTELTINGDLTGGGTSAAYGVKLEHTLGNIIMVGDVTGGSTSSTHGIYSASAGKFALTGNATGVSGHGVYSASSSVFTMVGDCIGSDTSGALGCSCGSNGYATITGNLIFGKVAAAVGGRCRWTPTAPASGQTGHYVKFDGGAASATYYGKVTDETAANEASKVSTGEYFIKSDTGATTQGTATATGGGAWGW